jgi:hypothetical protein
MGQRGHKWMANLNLISIIMVNVKELKTPIKKQRLLNCI